MVYVIIILLAALAASLMVNVYLRNEILDERRRTFEATEWIDPIAVESATHNAALNDVAEKTVVAHSNLLENTDVQGDIMMANITGEVLKMLAPSIPKNLKKDGVLILSGIIESRLEMVKAAYEAVGMEVVFERRKGEWFALVLKHRN